MSWSRKCFVKNWKINDKKETRIWTYNLCIIYDHDLCVSCSHATTGLRVLRNGKSGSAPKPTLFSRNKTVQYFPVSLFEENNLLTSILLFTCAGWRHFPVSAGCVPKTYFSASTEWISKVETMYFHQRIVLLRLELNKLYVRLIVCPIE